MQIKTLKELFVERNGNVGAWISIPVYDRSYTIETEKSGWKEKQIIRTAGMTRIPCKFAGQSDGELANFIGCITAFDVIFFGEKGYQHGTEEMNRLLMEIYGIQEYGIKSYSLTIDDKVPSKLYLDPRWYWLASPYIHPTDSEKVGLYRRYQNYDYGYILNNANRYELKGKYPLRPKFEIPINNEKIKVIMSESRNGDIDNAYEMILE